MVILGQTVAELFYFLPAAFVLRTFVQYLIAFCSRPETANEVIFGKFERLFVPKRSEKFALT